MTTDAQAPNHPGQLEKRSWVGVAKRTVKEFRDDNMTDWAAALTYYAVLAIFPALIVLVSLLGLIGESATQPLLDNLGKVAPGPAQEIFTNAITNLQKSQGAAGVLAIAGLAGALWSASGYTAAFMRASNAIYEVEEGRPIWKSLPVRVGVTLVLVLFSVAIAIAVVFTGGLAEQAGNVIGLGDTAVSVWSIAKWPVLLILVSLMFAILYWATPNVKQPGFRWISAGGIFAVLVWVVASLAFAFYVANFGSYNKTYGALGGVITFLVWLWVSNIAVLLGAEFNAELERGRQIEAGLKPTGREPFLPPRDTRKMDDPPDTSGIPDPTKRGGKKDADRGQPEGGGGGKTGRFKPATDGFEPREGKDAPKPAEGGGYEARPGDR
jgi:membrane protein